MPRPRIWPPKIHHHKRSNQARVRFNGRDYWLGAWGSPQVQRRYAELLVELASQNPPEPATIGPDPTVAEVVLRFLDHAERNYSRRGGQVIRFKRALGFVTDAFADLPAKGFGAEQLRAVRERMTEANLCTPTVNRHTIRIRTAWRWLEEDARLVPPGSWAALQAVGPIRVNHPLYKAPPERARSTTIEEVRQVCRHLPEALRAMLLFQFWTGARTGELVILRAGDVDTSREVWIYRPRQHKNDWRGQERAIPIGPRARAALAPWLACCQSPEEFVFPPCPHRRRGKGDRVIEHPRDLYDRSRGYTVYGYCQAIRRAADRAGLTHFFPYLSRHATRMRVSRLAGDEAARAVLGQRSIEVSQRYGELDQELARKTARQSG